MIYRILDAGNGKTSRTDHTQGPGGYLRRFIIKRQHDRNSVSRPACMQEPRTRVVKATEPSPIAFFSGVETGAVGTVEEKIGTGGRECISRSHARGWV